MQVLNTYMRIYLQQMKNGFFKLNIHFEWTKDREQKIAGQKIANKRSLGQMIGCTNDRLDK